MSDQLALELALPSGPLTIRWERAALERLSGGVREPVEAEIAPEPDWSRIASIRLLAAGLEDGTTLGLALARPVGAGGHDSDTLAATIAGSEADPSTFATTLVSTEFDEAGRLTRIGAELYRTEESVPLRLAGDALADPIVTSRGAVSVASTPMSIRVAGHAGAGVLQVLTAEPGG